MADGDGGDSDPGDSGLPEIVIHPPNLATDVVPITQIVASIDPDDAAQCRLSASTSTIMLTSDSGPVPGTIAISVEGLVAYFQPDGLLTFGGTYEVAVDVDCAQPATSTFTVLAGPAESPVVVDDVFRMENLSISQPQALAPMLRSWLASADTVYSTLEVGADSVRLLGSEGREADFPVADLFVLKEAGFLFSLLGQYAPPFFRVSGPLSLPVSAGTEVIDFSSFEIAGRFVSGASGLEVSGGHVRITATCDAFCSASDMDVQLICANRSAFCDEFDNLNVFGEFDGVANDLRSYQTFTSLTPASDAMDVATDAALGVSISRAVNVSRTGALVFELRDSTGALVAGSSTVDPSGLSGTFAPMAPLSPDMAYSALVIAQRAREWVFSTAP